jgi:hypothetical protein
MANVKTTSITKKYRDKNGKDQELTINLARVADRLKQFREENPRASIKSNSTRFDDGSIEFVTVIIKDKADEYSADADGHATYTKSELSQPKSFEKLETISMGRALAKLGYLNNGEVATTEEMDEFNEYKEKKLNESIALLNDCDTLDQLKTVFMGLGSLMANPKIVTAKDIKKLELQKESK